LTGDSPHVGPKLSPRAISERLFLGFGGLSDEHAEQGGQEMFTPNTGIMHELEKAQVQGQLLLRDPPMGPQPFDKLRAQGSGLRTA
jgi:hypothetical protein